MCFTPHCNYQKNAHINNNMKSICRVGDIGEGTCLAGHEDIPRDKPKPMKTKMITGSTNVLMNYKPIVCVGDIGKTDCGHTTKALTGSETVFVNFKPVHRVGDIGEVLDNGSLYKMITGSENGNAR
jgi:uncharacterized Zn-binding protein involved in type VI secretion